MKLTHLGSFGSFSSPPRISQGIIPSASLLYPMRIRLCRTMSAQMVRGSQFRLSFRSFSRIAPGGSYHVVEYNSTTGAVIRRRTSQGYADNR